MPLIEHGGETYRYRALSAFEQNRVLEFVRPVVAELRERRGDTAESRTSRYVEAAVRQAHDLSEEMASELLRIALGRTEVRQSEEPETWAPIWCEATNDALGEQFDGVLALTLAFAIARASLSRFLDYAPIEFTPSESRGARYAPVAVPGNLMWLTAPAIKGIVRFESLRDGTLDLADIALINDLLAVEAENSNRAHRAAEEEAAFRAGRH